MPDASLPASSPEFAAIICMAMSVLGDDPKLLRASLANGADIAKHIASMDSTLVRIRTAREDAKVRQDFVAAEAWLRAALAKIDQLGPF